MKADKLPSGSYRVRLYIGKDESGKAIYKSFTADTAKEARALAERYKYTQTPQNTSKMTVREAVSTYIDSIEGVSSPKTIREYIAYSKSHLQSIYDIPLSKLTKADVQKAVSDEAKNYSPKSVRNYYGLVSAALKQQGIKFDVRLPAKKKKEIVVPEEAELTEILDAVRDTPFYVPTLMASLCGMRRGEIGAISYTKDVDQKKKSLVINKAYTQDKNGVWFIKDTPKTYSSNRTVWLPDIVVDAINSEIEKGVDHTIHPAYITSGFGRVMKKLGKDVRFHDLRHFYASMLLAQNVPDQYAAKLMGHSSTNMLHSVYQHIMADKMNEIDARIQDHIKGISSEI